MPTRSLALLFLPVEDVPIVGQRRELRISAESTDGPSLSAIEFALVKDAGLIACVPKVENAVGIPWGGVIAEIRGMLRLKDDLLVVQLCGVSSARMVSRHPLKKWSSFAAALLQEVPEWGREEVTAGQAQLQQDIANLRQCFADCAELQRRSSYMNAGDFISETLDNRSNSLYTALEEVHLLSELGQELSPETRQAIAVCYAVVSCLSAATRVKFLCEPTTLLPRLKRLTEFLSKVRSLLQARIAFRRSFDEGAS
jgi:hypothetical protein